VLPEITAEAGDMAVMFDSGIRRGNDVLKALAMGAQFVFVGRPFLYAAAIAGEAGVAHAVNILSQEINRNLALLGVNSPQEVGQEALLRRYPPAVECSPAWS
jgi:L-lactate dehydrogenase (cytochrome)